MEPIKKRIFIIGAQRSGTTLLRLILNAHSQIAIPRETIFLMPFLKKKYLKRLFTYKILKDFNDYFLSNKKLANYNYYSDFFHQISKDDVFTLRDFIDRMFSYYCQKAGKVIWGNKTTSFFRKVDILFTLFPDAKFIHIVRDGRDMFDSWRRKDASKDNAAVVALDWSYKLYRIEKSFKKIPPDNKITIRYEDLLESSQETIKSVCSLIDVDYEPGMFDFYKTSSKNTSPTHSELIFKPLDKDNKDKWKRNLTLREIKIFNLLAGRYLKKYNYEIKNEILSLSDVLSMVKGILFGLPIRFIQIMGRKRFMEKAINIRELN